MRVIIAGTRDITRYSRLRLLMNIVMDMGWPDITEIVGGGATGVDRLGKRWASDNNLRYKEFLPNWEKYGKSAGMLRNSVMADYTTHGFTKSGGCVMIWDGKSPGTKSMNEIALAHRMLTALDVFKQTRVVHCKSEQHYDVYGGRGRDPNTGKIGQWGNDWSHKPDSLAKYIVGTRTQAVMEHRAYLRDRPDLIEKIRRELKGKVLGCWCWPGELCHCETLAAVADGEEP